jgi:CheY-like chemotaxis protein
MLDHHLSSVHRTPATVLVVEDDFDLRELLSDTLRRDGYLVLAASSAAEAADFLAGRGTTSRFCRIDLVLSDVRLDGATGLELGEHLRETRSATPLIFMTAFPEPAIEKAAARMGATLLPKPFGLDHLRRAVLTTIAAYVKSVERRPDEMD